MKKMLLLCMIILFISGCKTEEKTEISNSKILNYMEEMFANTEVKVYSDILNLKIYNNGKILDLKQGFQNQKITISEFLSQLDFIKEANDGGTKVYKSNDKIAYDTNFFVAQCKTLNENNNILISVKENVADFCQFE